MRAYLSCPLSPLCLIPWIYLVNLCCINSISSFYPLGCETRSIYNFPSFYINLNEMPLLLYWHFLAPNINIPATYHLNCLPFQHINIQWFLFRDTNIFQSFTVWKMICFHPPVANFQFLHIIVHLPCRNYSLSPRRLFWKLLANMTAYSFVYSANLDILHLGPLIQMIDRDREQLRPKHESLMSVIEFFWRDRHVPEL